MKICVLNGSPKGDISVTMQYGEVCELYSKQMTGFTESMDFMIFHRTTGVKE